MSNFDDTYNIIIQRTHTQFKVYDIDYDRNRFDSFTIHAKSLHDALYRVMINSLKRSRALDSSTIESARVSSLQLNTNSEHTIGLKYAALIGMCVFVISDKHKCYNKIDKWIRKDVFEQALCDELTPDELDKVVLNKLFEYSQITSADNSIIDKDFADELL